MHCQFWLPFFFWFLIVMIKWRTHWRIWKYTREGCFTLATTAASLTALWVKIPYLPSLKRLLGSWGKTIQMATASIVYGGCQPLQLQIMVLLWRKWWTSTVGLNHRCHRNTSHQVNMLWSVWLRNSRVAATAALPLLTIPTLTPLDHRRTLFLEE